MGMAALAAYELAAIACEEHKNSGVPEDRLKRIPHGITRFASVVFVAPVLEARMMAIKYCRQGLAGFLFYPVANAVFLIDCARHFHAPHNGAGV